MAQEIVNECWRSITRNTNYEVSNTGKVKNTTTGRILTGTKDKLGYVRVGLLRDGRFTSRLMHRLVAIAFLDNPDNKPNIDHIDHNPSNNAISNLRWATQQENTWNQVQQKHAGCDFKGVHKDGDRWRAQIQKNGRRKHLGRFETQQEAAKAYLDAAKQDFGEFAYSNFTLESETLLFVVA